MEDAASGNPSDVMNILVSCLYHMPCNCSKDEQGQECTENNWKCSVGKRRRIMSHEGRKIFFVVGGMCSSTLLSAREVMNTTGAEIVVRSTR